MSAGVGDSTFVRPEPSPWPQRIVSVVIPLLCLAASVCQFVVYQTVDKYLIGMLLVFGLGSLGWRMDLLVDRVVKPRRGHLVWLEPGEAVISRSQMDLVCAGVISVNEARAWITEPT